VEERGGITGNNYFFKITDPVKNSSGSVSGSTRDFSARSLVVGIPGTISPFGDGKKIIGNTKIYKLFSELLNYACETGI
jgi:hypothetical protein